MRRELAQELVHFINKSPSPFHAVKTAKDLFMSHGFVELQESVSPWNLKPNSKVLLDRNGTLFAIAIGGKYQPGNGFTLFGAHTDSPCIRLKPNSERKSVGFVQCAGETYGGGTWYTWFDRELALAGRCMVKSGNKLQEHLVHLNKPLAIIPSLAIHLNRDVNKQFGPNTETELVPVLYLDSKDQDSPTKTDTDYSKPVVNRHPAKLVKMISQELQCPESDIVELEMCFAPFEEARIGGENEEFIFAPRLDNLFNTFCGAKAMIHSLDSLAGDSHVRMAIFFDHEEIGSVSAQGADSCLTSSIMKRVIQSVSCSLGNKDMGQDSVYDLTISRSFLVSADQAHACHPNYKDKHEQAHQVALNGGVVLKYNQNQRYATNGFTAAVLRTVAEQAKVPVQEFVVRQDMGCGSTIGPMLSGKLGVSTIDTGSPQLAMHSAREMCGVASVEQAVNLYAEYFVALPRILANSNDVQMDQS